MPTRDKSDDIVGLGVQGVGSLGIESSGFGWSGMGGRPSLSPSLDLQFAIDKTLTARKGPTPSFTRASSATYIDSSGLIATASSNVARFDHDPLSLVCKGLLIEESRTNLVDYSQDMSASSSWSYVRTAIPTANTQVSPDGTTNAEKVIPDATAANNHRIDETTTSLALNSSYTFSVYAKASGYSGLAIGVSAVAPEIGVQFSLTGSGSITSTLAGYSGRIQQLANGWYRCSVTFTSNVAIAAHRSYIYIGQNGTTFTYTGDTTSGVILWGAQLELGSFETSYIITSGSPLQRSAEVCSISGSNFSNLWSSSAGSFSITSDSIGSSASSTYGTAAMLFTIESDGNNRISSYVNSGSVALEIVSGGTNYYVPTAKTFSASGTRVSVGFTAGSTSSGYHNNSAFSGGTNSNLVMPSVTIMYLGKSSGNNQINGHIASVKYFKKRISDSKLQSLTA